MPAVNVFHCAFEDEPVLVAQVKTSSQSMRGDLEVAYSLTQNMQGSWSRDDLDENPDRDKRVTVLAPLHVEDGKTYGLRSTSVGDLMQIDDEVHRVGMVGFERASVEDVEKLLRCVLQVPSTSRELRSFNQTIEDIINAKV